MKNKIKRKGMNFIKLPLLLKPFLYILTPRLDNDHTYGNKIYKSDKKSTFRLIKVFYSEERQKETTKH